MSLNTKFQLITKLRSQAEKLSFTQKDNLDLFIERLKMHTEKIFGEDSNYIDSVANISFKPIHSFANMPQIFYESAWKTGKRKIINLIDVMLEDLELEKIEKSGPYTKSSTKGDKDVNKTNIFVVHGHNNEMKESVARLIEKLNLNPIILHEKANKGRTIIQKFTDHSIVEFAVILLSADDFGHSKNTNPEEGKFRARQNVILELGFFLGKLGADKVVVLFDQNESFEFPSDYDGVIYIPYEFDGRWKFDLVKELKENGFNVDANQVI